MERYILTVNGIDHVVQCSPEVAERRGLKPVEGPKPATKKRTPANKAATPEDK